jgi:large subunit ribosomal protein L2
MGKRLLVQRRGRGTSVFKSPSWKRVGKVHYPPMTDSLCEFIVKDIVHDPGRGAPLAIIKDNKGTEAIIVAPEGLFVGQKIYVGPSASINVGNILPLRDIPDGTQVFNIEGRPGDGGKFVRTAGSYATVISHAGNNVLVQLPSGKVKSFNDLCRATIGIVAAGGIIEKPLLKAGAKYYKCKAKAIKYPTVRGKAMNPCSHPHGGGAHPTGSTPVSRNAPPGQKVGIIASRRTGRKKR